jgi:hypothetical protein
MSQEALFKKSHFIWTNISELGATEPLCRRGCSHEFPKFTSFQAFPPDIPADAPFEKFENTTAGQHSLATVRLLNLSKYSAKATLVICAGRITVTAAIEANLYQAALRDSLPSIRLSRAFPGDLKS